MRLGMLLDIGLDDLADRGPESVRDLVDRHG